MNVIDLQSTRSRHLITELQSLGLRLSDATVGAPSRRGGAGPSDHKAVTIDGRTVMVPVHTGTSTRSPFFAARDGAGALLERDGVPVARITFPPQPAFYGLATADGIPYWKIATLHGRDVLATTVVQDCIRYRNRKTQCQFCAIGESLKADRTIARKTPQQLGEVAAAAVRLDGVKHVVLTTGTPNVTDRGAAVLCESATGIRAAVDLPIQAQCEPPDDFAWFERLRTAGVAALGMHLEAVEPAVRARAMPGKAKVPIAYYLDAFAASVRVFGRGQVSTRTLSPASATRRNPSSRCARGSSRSASTLSSSPSYRSAERRSQRRALPNPTSCARCSRNSARCFATRISPRPTSKPVAANAVRVRRFRP